MSVEKDADAAYADGEGVSKDDVRDLWAKTQQGFDGLTEGRAGVLDMLVSDDVEVFSRLDHETGSNTLNAALKGWRAPFKHDGSAFDAVQFTVRAQSDNTRVLVKLWDVSFAEIARGYGTANATLGVVTAHLDRIVRDLGADAIAHISYEPADSGGVLGYPGGAGVNNYPAGDADPAVHREYYMTATGSWAIASPAGNYCIPFRALLINSSGGVGKIKELEGDILALDARIVQQSTEMGQVVKLAVGQTVTSYDLPGYTAHDAVYSNAGLGTQVPPQSSDYQFNRVTVWGGCNGVGKLRGYLVDPATNNTHQPATDGTLLFEQSIDWTTDVEARTESLDGLYSVPAGQELHLLWVSNAASSVQIGQRTSNPDNNLPRIRLSLTGAGDEAGIWSETWYEASPGFHAVPPKLELSNGDAQSDAAAIPPYFTMPSTINAVVGTELTLPYDGVVSAHSNGLAGFSGYSCTITGPKGQNWERHFAFTPQAADVGAHSFTAHLWDAARNLVATKGFTVNVVAATAKPSQKNVGMFGDSLTSPGIMTTAARNAFAALSGGVVPSFVGSQGAAPNNHEGYGGKTFQWFASDGGLSYRVMVSGVTSVSVDAVYEISGVNYTVEEVNITGGAGTLLLSGATAPAASGTMTRVSGSGDASISYSAMDVEPGNPLWNPSTSQLDVANYRSDIGLANPLDAVIFQLDINGLVSQTLRDDANIQARIDAAKALADAFLADNASCKVIMALPSLCGNTSGGFASNYGASYSREIYEANLFKMRKALIDTFDQGAYHANVSIGSAGLVIDRYYGYGRASAQVSDLIADTVERHVNAVHSITSGSNQMGVQHFCDLMAAL